MSLVVNDPLLQISEIVGHAGPMPSDTETVESLYQLYASSADIRACLRLVDPAYMDALSAAHLASEAVKKGGGDIVMDIVGAGTRMTRLLLAHALNSDSGNSSDTAATMLADIIDNSAVNCPQIPVASDIAQALLMRVRSGRPVRAHARLLRVAGSGGNQQLLCAVVDAIVAAPLGNSATDGSRLSQLLCVAAQLIEQDRRGALAVLAGLESLRGFARHVIKLLSVPAPIVAAPALHLLTLILLHPPAKVTAGQPQVSPLTILADGLCGKLFDATHIGRTLVLAADLCLNCQQAGNGHGTVDDDLVVLDAVAGMVTAIAHCEQSSNPALQAIRAAFFESTEIVPAIVHVVAMAKLDRRYLHSLLRMATAIVARPEDASTPLVRALTGESQGTLGLLPSVISELFELVLSGIEDIDDAMPRFGYSLPGSSEEPRLPRVSSDESGCCWLANCPATSRHDVARFLCAALNCPPPLGAGDEAERWGPLLIEAVSVALGPLFTRPSPPLEPTSLLGRYYWVDKPVLGLALYLAAGSLEFRALWQKYLAATNWPTTVCQEATSGNMLSLMYQEIADVFTMPSPSSASAAFLDDKLYHQAGHTQESAKSVAMQNDLVAAASVATPSNSSYTSSGAASPYQADGDNDVIAITDMRVAAAAASGPLGQEGMGISTPALQAGEENGSSVSASGQVYAVVLRQWLRTCEAEAALELAKSTDNSTDPIRLKLLGIIRQARLLVAPATVANITGNGANPLDTSEPPSFSAITSLIYGVSTAASLHRQHSLYVTALKAAVTQSVQQSHDRLLASTDTELMYLNGELNRAQARAEQLSADLGQTRKLADRWSADHNDLRQQHNELQAKHRKIETEADEWKQECVRARDHLELSERIARDAHQNLVVQHEAEKQRCVEKAIEAHQGAWDRHHSAMSDNVAALERALAEAVPRLRVLETQAETERLANAELRVQNAAMTAKLADLAHAATALHGIAQRPH
ncbi:hypothetical protein H4S04_000152 [Coemansia sp. S16]|nr:hypothetical protein H4S04_000152 [Coemansia sp. S16]KAJ2067445.1 hypothetical protein GGI08_001376 [Coemansia sp. S2]KAJ2353807.1 hypothetical protein GGH92_000426 [Coemansia sp. RSA 2673]